MRVLATRPRPPDERTDQTRAAVWIARGFSRVEDVVYVGLALMLSITAVVLLGYGAIDLWNAVRAGELGESVVTLLDRSSRR